MDDVFSLDETDSDSELDPEPELKLAREPVTASVNSEVSLPQKVMRRLTLSAWQAR